MCDNIGQFQAMDDAIYHRTYTEVTRICVEMDMGFDLLEEIFLENDDPSMEGYIQPLGYPKFLYRSHCHMVGHMAKRCKRLNGKTMVEEWIMDPKEKSPSG